MPALPGKCKDLVVLVADANAEHAMKGILSRAESLEIRTLFHDIFVHPMRDPGVYEEAHEFLRPLVRAYERCVDPAFVRLRTTLREWFGRGN